MKKNSELAPTVFVIFGATGDLAAKKIIPSLWHLFRQGRLPDHLAVIGFSRRTLSNTGFQKMVRETIKKRGEAGIKEKDFLRFFDAFSYHGSRM